MNTFTWTIIGTNESMRSMTVEYVKNGISVIVGMPIPLSNADLQGHIESFAPVTEWSRREEELNQVFLEVQVGATGSGTVISTQYPNLSSTGPSVEPPTT